MKDYKVDVPVAERVAFDEGSEQEVDGFDAVLIDLYNANREACDDEMRRLRGRLYMFTDEKLGPILGDATCMMIKENIRLMTGESWRGIQKGQTRVFRNEKVSLGVGPNVTFTRPKQRRNEQEAA